MDEQISVPVKNHVQRFREYRPAKHSLFPAGIPSDDKPWERKTVRQLRVDHAERDDRWHDLEGLKAAVAALELLVQQRPELDDAQRRYKSMIRAIDLLSKLSADQAMLDDLQGIARFICRIAHDHDNPA